MLEQFQKHIDDKLPFLIESKFLIAISGGLDSVVLTNLCHELKLDFALAHCNFKLRENESDQDENFVIKLAETLKSKLIENLAQKIADTILKEFPVSSIVVTVEKPGALRGSRSVGVTIKRP